MGVCNAFFELGGGGGRIPGREVELNHIKEWGVWHNSLNLGGGKGKKKFLALSSDIIFTGKALPWSLAHLGGRKKHKNVFPGGRNV